ncbi:MAG: pilin glycosylation protein PglB, partial [Actinomycetota bacterium]
VEHHNVIGAHCHIAIGAVLSGNVTVGERTHIGANATILQGVKIGSNCIIGAGAVVLHDVPDNHVAVGVPAVAKKRG